MSFTTIQMSFLNNAFLGCPLAVAATYLTSPAPPSFRVAKPLIREAAQKLIQIQTRLSITMGRFKAKNDITP